MRAVGFGSSIEVWSVNRVQFKFLASRLCVSRKQMLPYSTEGLRFLTRMVTSLDQVLPLVPSAPIIATLTVTSKCVPEPLRINSCVFIVLFIRQPWVLAIPSP